MSDYGKDTIYRQDAIDALHMDIDIIPFAKAREYARAVIETVHNRLEELPSAEPSPCDYCKHENDCEIGQYCPAERRGEQE